MYRNIEGSFETNHNKGAIAASFTATILVIASLTLTACAGAAAYKVQEDAQQFKVVALGISPSEVGPGEQAIATARIANIGSSDGQYDVVLKVDNAVQEVAGVNIPAGDSRIIQFSLTRTVPQIYKVSVGEQTALLTVSAQARNSGPASANTPGSLPPCCQPGATAGQSQVNTPVNLPPCCQPGAGQAAVAPRRGCCQ